MADGWKPRAFASHAAAFRIARGWVVAAVLGCARESLPVGAPLVERSGNPRAVGVAVAPARGAAPRAARPSSGPPAMPHGAVTHEPSRLCDLPDTAAEAPLFASSDTNLRERGTQILDDVIACMKAGLFGDHHLLVVGYADPRGGRLRNEALALERARAAQRYMIRRGLPPDCIQIASRGEREALGEAPESWLYDRRVEIRLLP